LAAIAENQAISAGVAPQQGAQNNIGGSCAIGWRRAAGGLSGSVARAIANRRQIEIDRTMFLYNSLTPVGNQSNPLLYESTLIITASRLNGRHACPSPSPRAWR
jgi:hypothetical protein